MSVTAPAVPDWHGRAPDRYGWECRTCGADLSTNNPAPELIGLFRDHHAGHEVVEFHRREEPCTGLAASWCPNCGDCTCPVVVEEDGTTGWPDARDDPACGLHGAASTHG